MRETLWIAFGGAIGSTARYWFSLWTLPISGQLPAGTIMINIIGSFAIGFFGTLTLANGRYPLPETARLFFMVGICGGFTTFSSFSLQTLDLLRSGAMVRALLNIGVSVVFCLCAIAMGHALAARLNSGSTQIAETMSEKSAA